MRYAGDGGDPRDVWNAAYTGASPPLARCPYDFVASFLFRFAPADRARGDVDVLELGFGGGANLWFAARQGFRVFGVDVSDEALTEARSLFARDGLAADLRRAEFSPLPFDDASFDLVFDRAALSYVDMTTASRAIAEVRRVLRDGGFFLFNPYSKRDSAAGDEPPSSPARTPFAHGKPGFYDRSDIERVADTGFAYREMLHVMAVDEWSPGQPCRAEWRVVLEARG